MHTIRTIRTLLSQLHADLFDDLSDTELSHITVNLISHSISGHYRAGITPAPVRVGGNSEVGRVGGCN
jgi:hypothetical protein